MRVIDARLKHCKINGEKSLSYTQFRTRYTKRKEKWLENEAIEMPNMWKGWHIGRERIRRTVKDQWIAEWKPCPYRTYAWRVKNKKIAFTS